MTDNPVQLDRKDLKVLAYKEKVASLQEENADLRVELTILTQQLTDALNRVSEYEGDTENAETAEA